jgi:hypothetical protein
MTDQIESLNDSLKRMNVLTIRKLISEAEAYLAEQSFSNILAAFKVGIGLGLSYDILPAVDNTVIHMVSTATADWKAMGKHIAAVGSLMNKAGIDFEVTAENTSDFNGGMYVICICAFPPPLKFLLDCDDPLSAQEVLEYLETTEPKTA